MHAEPVILYLIPLIREKDSNMIVFMDGNHELIINGVEIWVGTRAECEAKLSEHLASQEVSV